MFFFSRVGVLGQSIDTMAYPEVGKPMPELTIHNIKYFPKKSARISDFKGKWLLLDFWSIYCGACIERFPNINEMQEKLGDSIQTLLVGIQDERELIEPMYAKFRERQHLVMPCAFDSNLANRLNIGAVPHSILIDNKGIVRCIASSFNMADIEGFLTGNPPMLSSYSRWIHEMNNEREEHYDFNYQEPLLINNNGGNDTDFLFRSILSKWDRNLHHQYVPLKITQNIINGRFQVLGVPLEWLYNYAFFGQRDWDFHDTTRYGKDFVYPILEIEDSSRFKYSYKYSQNIYSYSLSLPPGLCTEQSIKRALQRELEACFGFETKLETRDCPCWKLIANEGAREKLKTKVKIPYYRQLAYRTGFIAGNYSFKSLVDWIRVNQQNKVVLDAAGIDGNIDISMDCIPTDFSDLKNVLHQNGLELVPSKVPMRVVVIRDKN